MDNDRRWKFGRAPALFIVAMCSGTTLVLQLLHALSQNGEIHISVIPLNAWRILLFITAILAMVVVAVSRNNTRHIDTICVIPNNDSHDIDTICVIPNNDNHDIDTICVIPNNDNHDIDTICVIPNNDNHNASTNLDVDKTHNGRQNGLPWWTRLSPRPFILTACMIGSVVFPVFNIYRASESLMCIEGKTSFTEAILSLNCLENIFVVLFCFCQLVFIFWFKGRGKSCLMKSCFSVIIAANIALIIKVAFNIIMISSTIDLYQQELNNNTNGENISVAEALIQDCFIKCKDGSTVADKTAIYFHKYTYHFTVEYAVFALWCLVRMWNITVSSSTVQPEEATQKNKRGRVSSETVSEPMDGASISTSSSDHVEEKVPLLGRKLPGRCKNLRKGVKSTVLLLSRYSFVITVVLLLAVFSIHLYTDIQVNTSNINEIVIGYYNRNVTYSDAYEIYSILQTIYTYVLCIVAFVGLILMAKEAKSHTTHDQICILLLLGTAGHLLLVLLETVDSVEQFFDKAHDDNMVEKILFLIKILLHYVGLYSQTLLVINANKLKIRRSSMDKGHQQYIKGIITFVGMCNVERWAADSFVAPTISKHINEIHHENVYDQKVWWFITQILYPFVILWRLISALMCFEACVRFKKKLNREK